MSSEVERLRAAMMAAHAHLIDRRFNGEWRAHHATEVLGAALGISPGARYEEIHGPLPPLGELDTPDDLAFVDPDGPVPNGPTYLTSIDTPDE